MDIHQSGMMAENPVPRGDQGGVLQSPAPIPSFPPQVWEGKTPRPIRGGRERAHTHSFQAHLHVESLKQVNNNK